MTPPSLLALVAVPPSTGATHRTCSHCQKSELPISDFPLSMGDLIPFATCKRHIQSNGSYWNKKGTHRWAPEWVVPRDTALDEIRARARIDSSSQVGGKWVFPMSAGEVVSQEDDKRLGIALLNLACGTVWTATKLRRSTKAPATASNVPQAIGVSQTSPHIVNCKLYFHRTSALVALEIPASALDAEPDLGHLVGAEQATAPSPPADPSPSSSQRLFPQSLNRGGRATLRAVVDDPAFDSSINGGQVTAKEIERLTNNEWLNDEILTFYGQLLNQRSALRPRPPGVNASHSFNSFFYQLFSEHGFKKVCRWTRKFDLFALDIVIIPININNSHWACAAINFRKQRFEYYDSLYPRREEVYHLLRSYLAKEHQDKKSSAIDLSKWTDYWDDTVPQQANHLDCGVFTCQFMECLSRDVEGFDFTQAQMPYFRKKMVVELTQKELIGELEEAKTGKAPRRVHRRRAV